MPRKVLDDAVLRHALEVFNAGGGLKEAAAAVEFNPDNLSKFLRSRGHAIPKIERPSARRKDLPDAEVVALYVGGLSELEIAQQFGISRSTVRTRLLEAGCEIRGQAEANVVSMSRMTAEQRQQRTQAAHDAIRGTKYAHDRLVRRALGLGGRKIAAFTGPGEDEFDQALTSLGIKFDRQKPVDKYNLDFAIGSVAVELKGGATGQANTWADRKRGRIKKLAEFDYRTCYLAFDTPIAMLMSLDYIVSNLDQMSREPALGGQYWVIGCRFETRTRIRNDLGQWASIPSTVKLVQTCRAFDV